MTVSGNEYRDHLLSHIGTERYVEALRISAERITALADAQAKAADIAG